MVTRAHGWVDPARWGRPHSAAPGPRLGVLDAMPAELRFDGLPEPFQQGAVGSCVAQSLGGAAAWLLGRAGWDMAVPDRVDLYARLRQRRGLLADDAGASVADGVDALREGWREDARCPTAWGPAWTAPPAPVPDDAPRLVSAEPLDFDVTAIAWELATGSPVVVGLAITAAWDAPAATLPDPGGAVLGGHAVMLVGYSQPRRAWRVRNSWGPEWGDAGEAWLPWTWTRAPWCGEAWALRAVRRMR